MVTQCRSEELTLSALQCPAASRVKKVKPAPSDDKTGEVEGGRGVTACFKYLTHSDRDVEESLACLLSYFPSGCRPVEPNQYFAARLARGLAWAWHCIVC